MAEQSNTVTIKLTKGRAFENIIGEQELKSQRETLSGKGFNIIPIRDKQGNILGFEDEMQQGIDLKTPTALSPEQRRTQESGGFQQGFAPQQQQDEEDFGRPDLSKSIEASSDLNQQIKEAESRLLRVQGKTSADFARLAKRTNMTLGDALKLGEAETKRQKDFIETLKDKKIALDELAFGKKLTPAQDIAERKSLESRLGKTRIEETIDPETGKIIGGVSEPVVTDKDLLSPEALAQKIELRRAGATNININPASAEERGKIAEIRTGIDAIDNAFNLFEEAFVGPIAGRVGQVQAIFGGNTQKRARFISALAQIKNKMVVAITGAAIGGTEEAKRILAEVPKDIDPVETYLANMTQSRRNFTDLERRRLEILGQSGLKVPGEPTAPREFTRQTEDLSNVKTDDLLKQIQ